MFSLSQDNQMESHETRDPMIRVTAMPADTNPYGGIFGGWLMSQMALGSGALASREGAGRAVVVSATDFAFPGVMQVGDELSVYCSVSRYGRTSITIEAEAIARERNGEATVRVAAGTFKFVLLDDEGEPRPVRAVNEAANPVPPGNDA
jgi:acyl-CoA thioesterase YciA